jgi:glycerol kinase
VPELLLAVDVGSSSLGVGVFSPAGVLLALATAPVRSNAPAPGRVEQDPSAIWRAVRRLTGQALARAGRGPADLAAIGLATQRASAMVWDRDTGAPLSPLVVWSDLRGAARAAELRRAGFGIAPQMAAAKLEAILAEARGRAPSARLAVGNIDAFLVARLSGGAVCATDRSQAWPTGYLDLKTMGWSAALIDHQGLDPALFPTLVDTWGPIGRTRRATLGAEVPITAVVADQQGALMAHGDVEGEAKATYGTAAVVDLDTGPAFVARSRALPPFVLSSVGGQTRFCLEGMVFSAGSALDWMRAALGLGDRARFEALAAGVADTAGAYVLPALQGLGAPYGDAERRAVIGGLSAAVGKGHLALAAMEGLAFRVREVFEAVYAAAGQPPPPALKVDGGMTANATFMQVQADLLGRPILRHAVREATACGAAICAGRGAGLLSGTDAAAFARYDRVFEPRLSADAAEARAKAWTARVYG